MEYSSLPFRPTLLYLQVSLPLVPLWEVLFLPGPPRSEILRINTRSSACKLENHTFDLIPSFYHLLTWRYSAWPVHRHLCLQLSISLCTLYASYVCLHVKVQTLVQLEGVVSVQTINRSVKNRWHHFCWNYTDGQHH